MTASISPIQPSERKRETICAPIVGIAFACILLFVSACGQQSVLPQGYMVSSEFGGRLVIYKTGSNTILVPPAFLSWQTEVDRFDVHGAIVYGTIHNPRATTTGGYRFFILDTNTDGVLLFLPPLSGPMLLPFSMFM